MKTKTTNLILDGCPGKRRPARLVAAILGLVLLIWGQVDVFAGQQPLEIPLNPGIAPVTIPNEIPPLSYKGFAIDGNLEANSLDAGVGDWVIGQPGGGGYVLSPGGVPLVSVTTFARKDLYDSAVDDVFSGSKFNENPTAWKWVTSPTSDKTDINNALVHIARDANGHIWGIIAGDRLSVNGSAYLDVEFLQKPITNVAGGTFITGGLNNGRTTNDFVLSFNFNGGGSKPALTLWKWKAVGSSFDYVDITSSITNDPKITVYGADNTNSVAVPFLAFGQGTYPNALQFVEAAVDLTALVLDFTDAGQACDQALGISTIFIKTKSSPAPDAELKDLVDPIQLKLILGASADAGADQKKCPGPTKTTFTVPGTAQPGFSDIASLVWSVESPKDGTVHFVSGEQCLGAACNSLTATVDVDAPTTNVVLRLTVTNVRGCYQYDDVTLTVNPPFDCSGTISGLQKVVAGSSGITYTGPSGDGQTGFAWSVDPTTGIAINGSANNSSVVLDLGSDASDFSLTLTFTDKNGCVQTCTYPVTVLTGPALCDLTGSDAVCGGATGVKYTITPPAGLPGPFSYTWSLVNNGLTAADFSPVPSTSDTEVTVNAGSVAGSYTVNVTITYGGGITAPPCSFTTVVNPNPDCSIGGLETVCPFSKGNQYGYAGASEIVAYSWSIDGVEIGTASTVSVDAGACHSTFTLRLDVTDANGCKNFCSILVTANDTTKPVPPTAPGDVDGQCDSDIPTAGKLTATDNCDGAIEVSPVDGPKVADAEGCGYTITRTWTFTDKCGNSSSVSQKIHVKDTTAPSITKCPGQVNAESCAAVLALPVSTTDASITYTQFTAEGGEASDNCSAVTVSYKDSYVSTACPIEIKRTFTVKDVCGNATTCDQNITFNDTVAPTIGCPADQTLSGCDTTVLSPAYSTAGSTITLDAFKALGGSASDTCGLQTNVAYIDKALTTSGCEKAKVERTFTVKDICGNPASCKQIITVKDITPPVIDSSTLPAGGDLGCKMPPDDATIKGQVKATDNCPGTVTINVSHQDKASGCDVTRKVTITASDACGNTSDSKTVTYTFMLDGGTPIVGLPARQAYYCPEDAVVIAPPSATDDCGIVAIVVTITNAAGSAIGSYASDGTSWTPAWPAGNTFEMTAGTYGFAVVATDKCGNTGSGFFKINVLADCTTHCTFTQGFYGNNSKGKGKFSWMNNTYTKSGLVNALLGQDGIIIGTISTGKYLKIAAGEADCIDARLPAGGPSAALTAGFIFSDADTCAIKLETGSGSLPLDKQGRKFRNNLLGQTITLALNLKLDPTLTVFKLESTSLCTLGGGGDITSKTIPSSVLSALGSKNTVQDLLDLANRALGGDPALSGMLSDIGSAAAAINEAFDECRVAVPCDL